MVLEITVLQFIKLKHQVLHHLVCSSNFRNIGKQIHDNESLCIPSVEVTARDIYGVKSGHLGSSSVSVVNGMIRRLFNIFEHQFYLLYKEDNITENLHTYCKNQVKLCDKQFHKLYNYIDTLDLGFDSRNTPSALSENVISLPFSHLP